MLDKRNVDLDTNMLVLAAGFTKKRGYIVFNSLDNVKTNAVFVITIDDKNFYYRVDELHATSDSVTVEVCASEYGYYAEFLSRRKVFDVRDLTHQRVTLVDDRKILDQLIESNNYC